MIGEWIFPVPFTSRAGCLEPGRCECIRSASGAAGLDSLLGEGERA